MSVLLRSLVLIGSRSPVSRKTRAGRRPFARQAAQQVLRNPRYILGSNLVQLLTP
ncbi:hypothetical protein [Cryobacterium sp. TMT2-15-1]|uniref:hypothetical protein n=1 Tax=Cryobacterium sp. TMT2-15-1 TaxID=1259246 RepID=UPI00141B3C46|nr:hypothetical protein [Cryobacterium sp. TMT2-15-1]